MESLPNFLVIGAQKCGTTYVHNSLKMSKHFWAPDNKELGYWLSPLIRIEELEDLFASADPEATYRFETTPGYFQLPHYSRGHKVDTALRISHYLGDIPLLLIVRNPVDRYLSAYTHHMFKGRVPQQKFLSDIDTRHNMIELGYYGRILLHFKKHFSNIQVISHQEISDKPAATLRKVFANLGLDFDLTQSELSFRSNGKLAHAKKKSIEPRELPELTSELRMSLWELYKKDLDLLKSLTGLSL